MSPGLDSIRDSALETKAAALYSPALPYHNFEHIQDTLRSAALIVDRCREESIRIDERVVYYALLFHDAGYHEDHRALGFDTKEAYSAALASRELEAAGVSVKVIAKVERAIMATEKNGSFVSAEQKAVRAADLSGMAAEYEVFLQSSLRLKREFELLHRRELSWADWQQNSKDVLEFYLGQEIRLTSYFHDASGASAFHRGVKDNLTRLLAEPEEPAPA